jgi:hypothetical protein
VGTIASYGLAIVGFVVMIVATAPAFANSMNYPSAKLMLVNLLRTNPNRAEDVCRSMPGTFFEAIGSAIKTAAMAKSRDPKIVTSATRPGYDAIASTVGIRYTMILTKAKLAGMALVGGLAVAISSGAFPLVHILLGVGGGILVVIVLVRKNDAEASVIKARAEILPEAERAMIEGRYIFPPG